MYLKTFSLICGLAAMTGCMSPQVNPDLISTTPISPQQFAQAARAVQICADGTPDNAAIIKTLNQNGFLPTRDTGMASRARSQPGVRVFESADGQVVVLIGSNFIEDGCLVGAYGMTPEQSFQLAQPWVEKFGALTNAERGQGLSPLVVQAWGAREGDSIIYIAAFKTWDLLEAPGAAVRLLYIER